MLIIVTVAAFGTMALVHRLRRYHRKVKTITFGRMCVCLCDFRHTNQPTALKLWHNIPHVIIKFLPFFYISLRFLCNFEEQLCRNKNRDRNEILFAHKLTGQRQKFIGKIFDRKWPGFLLCLFDFQIVSPDKNSHQNFVINK